MISRATRLAVCERDHWACIECGKPFGMGYGFSMAHRIPRSRAMLRKYGTIIVNHAMNLRLTCSLTCNDAQSISAHYEQERELVAAIRADLARETEI